MRKMRKGFTLVEMLVVMAIIAILAGILMPVFVQAREKARAISCVSNLKQLAMAELMYAEDNNGCLSPIYATGQNWQRTGYWPHILYPYVRNKAVYICPTSKYEKWHDWYQRPPDVEDVVSSYGLNCTVFNLFPLPKVGSIKRPSDCFMMADTKGALWLGPHFGFPGNLVPGGCIATQLVLHHSEGLNVAYFDGHVKWSKAQSFWAPSIWHLKLCLPWANAEQYLLPR